MTAATIFGSFPSPSIQPAAVSAPATSVAAMFDSFGHDGAPLADSNSVSTGTDNSVAAGIFESYSNYPAVVLASAPGPVATAASAFVARIRQAFDRWAASNAQARADARLWDIACSDPRIMDELMQAQTRDDSETLGTPVTMAVVAEPAADQPRQRAVGLNWGRIMEDAYQHRFRQSRHQTA